MKKLVEKVGADNVLHFLGGGWLTLLIGLVIYWLFNVDNFSMNVSLILGGFITMALEYFKEWKLDDNFDWHDVLATLVGVVISIVIVVLAYTAGTTPINNF